MQFINFLKNNNYSINTIRTYNSILLLYEDDIKDIRLIRKRLLSYPNPNTVCTHYNVLLSYMKFTKDKRINELKKIKLPKIPMKYLEVFSRRFLYQKTDDLTDQKCVLVRFLFETGIRVAELATVKNINTRTLTVLGKGNKEREVFHRWATTKLIKNLNYTPKTIRIWVKEVLSDHYTPHSIRRSHATYMLMNGANPKSVMMQLGHSKIETTYKYLQLSKGINQKIYTKYMNKGEES